MNDKYKLPLFYLINFLIPFVFFIILELFLRIIFPHEIINYQEIIKKYKNDIAYEHNDKYLINLKPNLTRTFLRLPINGGETIRWETNSKGFRGKELEEIYQYRIIVYGDSNVQAQFSQLENTFPYVLKNYLEKYSSKKINVINGGIIGAGPDQYLIKMIDEYNKFKPDMVIFNIFTDNDFGDLIRNRLFELNDNQFSAVNHKITMDDAFKPPSRLSTTLTWRAIKKIIKHAMRYLSGSVNNDDKIVADSLKLCGNEFIVYKKRLPKKFSHFADHYDIDIATSPDNESSQAKKQLMNRILEEAKKFTASRGVHFIVLIEPSSVDLTLNGDSLNYKILSNYSNYDRTRLTSWIVDICNKNQIEYVNLYDVFAVNNPASLYFKGADDHWNDRGQNIAAQYTSFYIANNVFGKEAH